MVLQNDQTITKFKLNTVKEAINDIKASKIVIVVDDEDRENEGDFICAAECVTPEIINFMATHGRGLICSPITELRAKELQLHRMVSQNTDIHGTAFTISVDYKKEGCTTGISAYDRATGIRALVNPATQPTDYARPGHIFPLIAKSGGVLRRVGHTEAAIDLAELAGFQPAGVLVEILNEDGSMARLPQLMEIAKRFDLKIITIKDLVTYRMQRERLIRRELSVSLDTPFGPCELIAYRELTSNIIHLALKKGNWEQDEPVLTRVYSSNYSGSLMAIILRGIGQELHRTLKIIAREGKGLLLFLRQKEEEDSLIETLQLLKDQQDQGVKFNPFSGRNSESIQKELGIGSQILLDQNIRKIRLLTNTPSGRTSVDKYGLEIVEYVPVSEE